MERLCKKPLALLLAAVISFFGFATPANAHDILGAGSIETIQMENGPVSIDDIRGRYIWTSKKYSFLLLSFC